jgi:hypothetical protein
MTDADIIAAAVRLADIEHELDTQSWQSESPFYAALFARSEDILRSIPHEVYGTPQFFSAYGRRRCERNELAERGVPFAVVDGGGL